MMSCVVRVRFFGPDVAGDEIGELFGKMGNHLPLNALCRMFDIDERKSRGEPRFPLRSSRQTVV
jgi:predicted membrane chloride channel (bestrophin family)